MDILIVATDICLTADLYQFFMVKHSGAGVDDSD